MNRVFCGLDIGNSKLTAVLARAEKSGVRILGGELSPVSGLSKGIVQDLPNLTISIDKVIERLQSKTNIKINRLLMSVNGNYITARSSQAAVALSDKANRHISLFDIRNLRRQARLLGIHMEETVLHEFPQVYILDDAHSTFKPIGLLARKVILNSYILSASHTMLGNIVTAVEQAGYTVSDILFSSVASSFSVLTEEEKIRGVILLDSGAFLTNILFFKDNILRDFKMISFGGNDITDDISNSLGLSWELAEELKKTSLVLSPSDSKNSDKVIVRRSGSYSTLERKSIYESTKVRLDEFLSQIKNSISSSVWKDKIECGIVGVGGTANLEGILEKIESITGLSTKLGYVNSHSLENDIKGPQYAAAVGLISYGLNPEGQYGTKMWFMGNNPKERIANFLRQLYQEYF